MTDREDALRTLFAEELGDDWEPGAIPGMNRLSYQERRQLKNGPDPTFVEEQLAETERGVQRMSRVCNVCLVFVVLMLPLSFSFGGGDSTWGFYLSGLLTAAPFAALALILQRHAHHRKRRLAYRALRLLAADETRIPA